MPTKDDRDDGRGTAFFIGLVIVSLVVGNINSQYAGWLTFGLGLMIAALL